MTAATGRRHRELGTIHCLKRDLGIDDETYRNMLWTCARVRSAKDLDSHGRQTVIDHMRSRQERHTQAGQPTYDRSRWERRQQKYPGRHSRVDRSPQLQKIEAILADLGLPWSYADAIARRVAGVQKVAWVKNADRLRAIIAALTYEQQKRDLLAGVDTRLREFGLDREQLGERLGLKAGWDRNIVGLKTALEGLDRIRAEITEAQRE